MFIIKHFFSGWGGRCDESGEIHCGSKKKPQGVTPSDVSADRDNILAPKKQTNCKMGAWGGSRAVDKREACTLLTEVTMKISSDVTAAVPYITTPGVSEE